MHRPQAGRDELEVREQQNEGQKKVGRLAKSRDKAGRHAG